MLCSDTPFIPPPHLKFSVCNPQKKYQMLNTYVHCAHSKMPVRMECVCVCAVFSVVMENVLCFFSRFMVFVS